MLMKILLIVTTFLSVKIDSVEYEDECHDLGESCQDPSDCCRGHCYFFNQDFGVCRHRTARYSFRSGRLANYGSQSSSAPLFRMKRCLSEGQKCYSSHDCCSRYCNGVDFRCKSLPTNYLLVSMSGRGY